ncbi:MAG TPA: hypothetical protein VJ891_08000 [Casimicrobiaceae bacterium]|nr:hypothetical protein [Casimicrobiaceae bacterium]
MRDASLPVTMIVVGIGWLLWEFRLFPDIDWIIGLGFIVGGIAVIALDGLNKSSVVVGPFLIAVGIAWLAHDRYGTHWRYIVPAMLVLLGALMLIARSAKVPERRTREHDVSRQE